MCVCFPQGTLRRVTFSVVSQPQDGGCYDSGLEDSETPSSKSSSGPRLGALPLPEEGYERTTPEGSVGEEEHVENGQSTQTNTQTNSSSSFIAIVLCLSRPFTAHVYLSALQRDTRAQTHTCTYAHTNALKPCHQGLRRFFCSNRTGSLFEFLFSKR